MIPSLRHANWVVIAALVVSIPSVYGVVTGTVDPVTALGRFIVALVVIAAGFMVVERVVGPYKREARRREILRQVEAVRAARVAAEQARQEQREQERQRRENGAPS